VLISSGGEDLVYRTVDDVPPPLRTQLLKSTNSGNSATILIADRRGRNHLENALRKAPAQRRLRESLLTPRWRYAVLAVVLIACIALIAFVFAHRW
jgi:hypothetical protein